MPATKTSPTTPREVAVLAATGTPGGFARVASGGKWHLPRHLQLLNRYLSELAARRIKRLIVQEPPRHGKSEFCSKYFPAWYTGTFPHHRTALCSYEANFAAEWGGKSRELLERWGSLFKTRVKQNSRASDNWATDAGGGMVTTGIGGPLTGRGCNCLIIDDPIKNAEESLSPTIRDRHWDWWQSTASTRLEPDGVVLVLMTRWNDDDLVGRIMAAEPGVWTVLSLPAIAGENDALGRQPGEALWPERWPIEALEAKRRALDPFWWNALYQQVPGNHARSEWPKEYFDDLLTDDWPTAHGFEVSSLAIDPSKGKDAKSGDYSAEVFAGLSRGRLWVDADLERRTTDKIVDDALRHVLRFAPNGVGIEANQFQELLGPIFLANAAEKRMAPPPLFMIDNQVAKALRIRRLGPYLANKLLRIRNNSGGRLLVEQLKQFPHGQHDDGPDALEMALRLIVELQGGTVSDTDLSHG